MTKPHHIAEWARVRETSLEIAEAIFELAHGDETWRNRFGKKETMMFCRGPSPKRIRTSSTGAMRPSPAQMSSPHYPRPPYPPRYAV